MRFFRLSRPVVFTSLTTAAAAALLGCQHMLAVSRAPAVVTPNAEPALQRTELPSATVEAASWMPAATPSGTFEEPFRRWPAMAPNVTLAPVAGSPSAPIEPEPAVHARRPVRDVYESGIASTYGAGDGFEGLRTGCGGIFHTDVVQVAHKSLPCGTIVRVEDTGSGKSVDAEVTDRGPYVAGRIVDLSLAAFKQLDASGTGLLNVNVYVLDTANQYPYRLR
jgi:rare lipoprotein A (peptidoglycan hydrolase)